MKNYEQTLISLAETKTVANHIKDLGRISTETEDKTLISLLEIVTREFQRFYAAPRNTAKSMPFRGDKYESSCINNLVVYCRRTIGQKKPEWQTMAERNGWKPSN